MATPLEELSTYKSKRAAMKSFLDALYAMGGRAEMVVGSSNGVGTRKNATTVIFERMPEEHRKNPADTWNKLRDGGWINVDQRSKVVPLVELAVPVLPWHTNGDTPTSDTKAVGPIAEEPSPVEPAPPSAGDDEADDLGMRPGRLAARIEASIPGLVRGAVESVLRERERLQFASLGYWPTVDPPTLEKMEADIAAHDRREALIQSRLDDVNMDNARLSAMLDFLQDEVDAQRVKTNDYTPASKAMSVAKVPEHYRNIARTALQQGWTIQMTRGGHLSWRSPEGKSTFSGSTPNRNSINVLTKKLLRLGLKIEGRSNEVADVTQSGQVL